MLPVASAINLTLGSPGPWPPNAGWWLAALYLAFVLITGLAVVPQAWGSVEVDEPGLHVRGRLVVPANQLGAVELLSGGAATSVSWIGHREHGWLKTRQNLYGGGFGWGKGVLVEQRKPGGEVSLWLLPGPRAKELAEALQAVRTSGRRTTGRASS
ncbi:MAG: hypothetical protein KY441_07990 [Actinobacteria bacterium]|nr:hypothetical protein [Actinomycetota bacterium]